ncbi:MAG: hypothetical protein E6J45_04595 [Chloroflexi bacterium]|nr:MAG: hypothetical protein E6J45_04595 [Chloroflexota bacterium]
MSAAHRRRLGGRIIAAGSLLQLIAAALPDARVFTSSDPRTQLEAIAARPRGWAAQAVGFPLAFSLTALGFATVAAAMPDRRTRRLARMAAALSAASTVLWVPIAVRRIEIGRRVDAMLAEQQPVVDIGARTFWPYTVATLGSLICMGSALALSGLHRRLGAVVAVAGALAMLALPRLRDWPPFLSYVGTLALGVGVARGPEQRRMHSA